MGLGTPARSVGVVLLVAAALAACRAQPESRQGASPDPSAPSEPARPAFEAPRPAEVSPPSYDRDGVAWLVVDATTGRVVSTRRVDVLDRPILPGSLAKVITLAAAVDSGLVDERTRLTCDRRVRVGARVLDCAHAAFPAPIDLGTALAESCNDVFVTLGERLPVAGFASTAHALGVTTAGAAGDMRLVAVGLAGARVPPRRFVEVMRHLVRDGEVPGVSEHARLVVVDGMRDAAQTGTASAFDERGLDAFAKTGTTRSGTGESIGLVMAAWPAGRPTRAMVLAVAGGAGRDAAALAADLARDIDAGGLVGEVASAEGPAPVVRVGRVRDAAYLVDLLALEEYVAGVVAAEAPAGAPPALLDALAVLARTYARAGRHRHAADGFEVCDLTHCQALGRPTPAGSAAAERTRGLVLLDGHELAEVFYTADCGGVGAGPGEVWPQDRTGRSTGGPDPGPHVSPEWTTEVHLPRLGDALKRAGLRGDRLVGVTVRARSASGRVARVALEGLTPGEIDGEAFRLAVGRTLGWQVLKSTAFDITPTAAGVRFTGRGRGHGVGLCVAGAASLAAGTADSRALLDTYFPGLVVGRLVELTLDLPLAVERERARLRALVLDSIRRLAAMLATAPPWAVHVRVHPTVGSYERATGLPWWTAGTVVDGRIELLPLEALAGRRQVERTVRHEVVHLLTATTFAGRPRWVQEGAAVYHSAALGGETIVPAPASAPCPDDAEFAAARSAEALSSLHRRAAACYARDHGVRS